MYSEHNDLGKVHAELIFPVKQRLNNLNRTCTCTCDHDNYKMSIVALQNVKVGHHSMFSYPSLCSILIT